MDFDQPHYPLNFSSLIIAPSRSSGQKYTLCGPAVKCPDVFVLVLNFGFKPWRCCIFAVWAFFYPSLAFVVGSALVLLGLYRCISNYWRRRESLDWGDFRNIFMCPVPEMFIKKHIFCFEILCKQGCHRMPHGFCIKNPSTNFIKNTTNAGVLQ